MKINVIAAIREYGAGSVAEPAPYTAGDGCQLAAGTEENADPGRLITQMPHATRPRHLCL